ncbi:MAG: tetratricopeptide repeat protein [bacterium]
MDKTSVKPEIKKIKTQIDRMHKGGQTKKAIELCKSALKLNPTDADLHVKLGDLYLEKHLDIYQAKQCIDEAITEYQRALESNLDSPIIYYKLGVAFYHKGNLDKAACYLNLCLEHNNKMANAYLMLAKILIKKEKFNEAALNLKKAVKFGKLSSSRANYLLYLLFKSSVTNNFMRYIGAYWHLFLSIFTLFFDKEAQKELFKRLSYIKFIPIFIEGYYLEKAGNIYKVIDLYSKAIESAPGFLPLYILLGDAYKSIGKINDAINEYKMALWLDSTSIVACKSLCALYEEQGDYSNAIKIYQKLIEIYPKNPVYYSNLANVLYLKGELKAAISNYQTAIILNPDKNWTSIIAQTVGYIFHESKENLDAAISAYQSAFLLNPSDIEIYINLGSAFYDKGDHNNALIAYHAALKIDPNNPRIHCNLGYLLWNKGLIDESIKEYEQAIKLDPNYDIAYNNLGVIYLDDFGNIQKATELFQQAVKYNPNYALAYYNMGRAAAIRGDQIEAARLFQVALDLNSYTNELDNNEIKARIDDLFN